MNLSLIRSVILTLIMGCVGVFSTYASQPKPFYGGIIQFKETVPVKLEDAHKAATALQQTIATHKNDLGAQLNALASFKMPDMACMASQHIHGALQFAPNLDTSTMGKLYVTLNNIFDIVKSSAQAAATPVEEATVRAAFASLENTFNAFELGLFAQNLDDKSKAAPFYKDYARFKTMAQTTRDFLLGQEEKLAAVNEKLAASNKNAACQAALVAFASLANAKDFKDKVATLKNSPEADYEKILLEFMKATIVAMTPGFFYGSRWSKIKDWQLWQELYAAGLVIQMHLNKENLARPAIIELVDDLHAALLKAEEASCWKIICCRK